MCRCCAESGLEEFAPFGVDSFGETNESAVSPAGCVKGMCRRRWVMVVHAGVRMSDHVGLLMLMGRRTWLPQPHHFDFCFVVGENIADCWRRRSEVRWQLHS
jgi:hypothetical protein